MGLKLDLLRKVLKFITKIELKQPINEVTKKVVPPQAPKTKVYIPQVAYDKATKMYSWVNPSGNTIYWKRYEQKSISQLVEELSKKIATEKSGDQLKGLESERMILNLLGRKLPQSEILGVGTEFLIKDGNLKSRVGEIDIATSLFNVEVKASLVSLKRKQLQIISNPKDPRFHNYNYKPTIVIITDPNIKFKDIWGSGANGLRTDRVKLAFRNGIYTITSDKEGMAMLDKLIANRHLLKFKPTHPSSFKLYEIPKATSITPSNTNRKPILKLKS